MAYRKKLKTGKVYGVPDTFRLGIVFLLLPYRNTQIKVNKTVIFSVELYRGADKSLVRTGFKSTRVRFSVDFYEYWY
jgi:hypothetical protein